MSCLVVVDDSAVVRDAIKSLLATESPKWNICAEASEEKEALRKCEELKPEVILVDLSLASGSGLSTAKALREKIPTAKILIMSAQDPSVLASVTHTHGFECVGKSQLATDLPAILRRVLEGGASTGQL
jgi:two-component system, NarL family, response regulator NreC